LHHKKKKEEKEEDSKPKSKEIREKTERKDVENKSSHNRKRERSRERTEENQQDEKDSYSNERQGLYRDYNPNRDKKRDFERRDSAPKKKLLWGKKTDKTFEQTKWSGVEFEDPEKRDKFLQLMGAKKLKSESYDPEETSSPEKEQSTNPTAILTLEQQNRVFSDLEKQFNDGVRRNAQKSGLG